MSDDLPNGYYPLDSDAPVVFLDDRIKTYLDIGFIALLAYDYILTLDKEVEWIWTLKWRLPKFLFFVNRYVTPALLFFNAGTNTIFPIPIHPVCAAEIPLSLWISVIAFTTAELVLVVRVCALYEHRKLLVRSLIGLFTLQMIVVFTLTIIIGKNLEPTLYYDHLPGCWSYTAIDYLWSFWIPFVAFDGIIMLLTLYKVFSYRKDLNHTITVLARDSVIYFLIMFACLIVNLVTRRLDIQANVQIPSECIACIAVARMMMNIRGLAFDDPDCSVNLTAMQLESLQFGSPDSEAINLEQLV